MVASEERAGMIAAGVPVEVLWSFAGFRTITLAILPAMHILKFGLKNIWVRDRGRPDALSRRRNGWV